MRIMGELGKKEERDKANVGFGRSHLGTAHTAIVLSKEHDLMPARVMTVL